MRRLVFTFLMLAMPAFAGTLTGTVRNGTTSTLAAGQDVVLIKLQGGMEGIETVKTDAQGRFQFDRPEIGAQPLLVRVPYKGVNYHQNVPPGKSVANVEIYEPTATAKDLQVASRALIIQPNGSTLLVGEEFTIENRSQPAAAFSKEFEFFIPEGAELAQVSAWGPAGMPVVQGTTTKGKNHYGVPFPLRPGQNGVRVSYQLPYATNQATIGTASIYPAGRVMVIAPPTMQVQGNGFAPAGTEQGWNVYARTGLEAGAALSVSVSGTAPPPSPADSGAQQGGGQTAGDPAAGMQVQALPGRLDNLKWILVGGFAAVFFLGVMFLMRKPAGPVLAGAESLGPQQAAPPAVTQAREQIEREVKGSLDEIRDSLFRLELRRQAGTISEEDYLREHARAEKVLRDLVRG